MDEYTHFVKQSIQLLNEEMLKLKYLPTIDNVYHDKGKLFMNYFSFDNFMFLMKVNKYVPVAKFKLIYPLLTTNSIIFKN
jgi:hypothetical protein